MSAGSSRSSSWLDRGPEVKTIRRRIGRLASAHKADRLLAGLARRHARAHDEAVGVLYVDGHVRAYHGGADVPKAHGARIRLSMPAEVDTWVADANGDGLLVWNAPPGASLVGELRRPHRHPNHLPRHQPQTLTEMLDRFGDSG